MTQRIAEGNQAARETENLESLLSEEIKQRSDEHEQIARHTLESMDDIAWGLVELTRTTDEQAEKVNAEYAARRDDQIGQRLEHFNGELTSAHTLEENPGRRNALDRIWGKSGSA